MLTVVATYRTGPSATRGVAYLLARHAAASEQEPGCRQFLVHQALA
jgi:quinol monooxygenase YgiN